MHFFLRVLAGAALLGGTLNALAQDVPTKKYKVNFPPSAELRYAIKSQQKGFAVEGEAVVRWTVNAERFSVTSETRAMILGKILETRSEGIIDGYGLAPVSFMEKRARKEASTASFDHSTKTISFTSSDMKYPIKGGEQDRGSVVWQLIAMARAAPAKFKPGSEWHFFVIGPRDADPWSFKVVSNDKVELPSGVINTVHISRAPPEDSQDQTLDIWLAPTKEWYPVKLRFSEREGDYIEQVLVNVSKKTP